MSAPILSFSSPTGNNFELHLEGVYVQKNNQKPKLLCGHIAVIGRGASRDGRACCRVVEFFDFGGEKRSYLFYDRDLETPSRIVAPLRDRGFTMHQVNSHSARDFVDYMNHYPCDHSFTTVSQFGWYEIARVFLVPNMQSENHMTVIGDLDQELVFVGDTQSCPKYSMSGQLKRWKDTVATQAQYSSRIVLAISIGFATPLLKLVNFATGGFHLVGRTSRGKSTALKALCSVWGSPGLGGDLGVWRGTCNGLEAVAAIHDDFPLLLDELGGGNLQELATNLYLLAGERSKNRQQKNQQAMPVKNWSVLFMSTGELDLASLCHASTRQTGAFVRMPSIEADSNPDFGIFDFIPDGMSSAQLAEAITRDASKYYGVAGPAFIKKLIQHCKRFQKFEVTLQKLMETWIEEHMVARAPELRRIAQRFALVAAAGELASEWGICPWKAGLASWAAGQCFKSVSSTFETADQRDDHLCDVAINGVVSYAKHFTFVFAKTGDNQRSRLDYQIDPNFGCVLKQDLASAPAVIVYTLEGLHQVCKGLSVAEVLSSLHKRNMLYSNENRKNKYYKVGSSKLLEVIPPCSRVFMIVVASGWTSEVERRLGRLGPACAKLAKKQTNN